MNTGRRAALALTLLAAVVLCAPMAAPHDPARQFSKFPYAPPMRVHVFDDD